MGAPARLAGLVLVASLAASACGRHAGPPPRLPGAFPPARAGEGRAIATSALALQGSPYRNAGTDPTGFDCSGLVQYVFAKHGVMLPRGVRQQYAAGDAVARNALAAGDLVFFTTVAPGASHVGIVVEEDWFVHAPSARGVVRLDRLGAPYWAQRYVGAKRVVGGRAESRK
jgi:cell wall-associated NlpC family hydrolase